MLSSLVSEHVQRPKPIQGASFNFHEVGKARDGFPLTRNLHVSTHANFTRVNKIEAMYGKSRVNVKVERDSTFFFPASLPLYILFPRVKFTCIRT